MLLHNRVNPNLIGKRAEDDDEDEDEQGNTTKAQFNCHALA